MAYLAIDQRVADSTHSGVDPDDLINWGNVTGPLDSSLQNLYDGSQALVDGTHPTFGNASATIAQQTEGLHSLIRSFTMKWGTRGDGTYRFQGADQRDDFGPNTTSAFLLGEHLLTDGNAFSFSPEWVALIGSFSDVAYRVKGLGMQWWPGTFTVGDGQYAYAILSVYDGTLGTGSLLGSVQSPLFHNNIATGLADGTAPFIGIGESTSATAAIRSWKLEIHKSNVSSVDLGLTEISINQVTLGARIPALSGTAYSLTSQQGSYTLTGESAVPRVSRVVTAQQGAFTLTGQTANLSSARSMGAGMGQFNLTGFPARLLKFRFIPTVEQIYVGGTSRILVVDP